MLFFGSPPGRHGAFLAEGPPPVHQHSAVARPGRDDVPAPRQAPTGPEDGEPRPAARPRSLPAVGHRGPENLRATVPQRGKASWLSDLGSTLPGVLGT